MDREPQEDSNGVIESFWDGHGVEFKAKYVFDREKSIFEVHDTFPQGRFCGVKNAFLEAKWRFPAGAFFSAKKHVF